MGLKTFFLNLLFPIECLGCSREGSWLCENCLKKIRFSDPEKARGLKAPAVDKIFIAGDYDDPLLSEAIKKFKYGFIAALGSDLGRFLILFWQGRLTLGEPAGLSEPAAVNGSGKTAEPILVPLPLSKKRLRWRGFNQAEILAREMAAAFGYPLDSHLKRKHRTAQAGLDEKDRLENLRGAFAWTGESLKDRTVILIDDVVTTGATLNEASRVLKGAGAARVYGLVLAKG